MLILSLPAGRASTRSSRIADSHVSADYALSSHDQVRHTCSLSQNRTFCPRRTRHPARLRNVQSRRSDFLPEQWKRLHASADRVERTVRKYA